MDRTRLAVLGIVSTAVMLVLAVAPSPGADAAETAQGFLDEAGISRGVCAVIGCEDGKLALALVRNSGLTVHVTDDRPEAVAAARKAVDVDGLWCRRVVVELARPDKLPYADNTIDLVVSHRPLERLRTVPLEEVQRVLRPGGKAILAPTDGGRRATIVKPAPKGVDDWPHWQRGPDNNPVSTDRVIRAPYMTQWMGRPYYTAMPVTTVAAGGRVFVAMGHIAHHKREWVHLNTLMARNGYNGAVLWTRYLPEGYMVHRSAFIAKPDAFHMIDGSRCLTLDPETGREIGQIRVPALKEPWEWMAMAGDTLYVLSGPGSKAQTTRRTRATGHWSWGHLSPGYYAKRVPWGFGTTLTAYDMKGGRIRWQHLADKGKPIDARAMAVGGGKVFYYAPDAHVGCLDAATGQAEWTHDDAATLRLIEQPGRGLRSTPGFRSTCFVLYSPEALVFEAQTRMNVVVLSPRTGKALWHRRKTTNNPNPIHLDGKLVLGIGPAGRHQVIEPATGEVLADLGFAKVSCTRLTATPDSLFVRGEGLLRYDRAAGKVLVNGAVRAGCNDGAIPAHGLLYVGPWLCDCNLSLMGTVTMCPAGDFRFDRVATDAERLTTAPGDAAKVVAAPADGDDWPTYRGGVHRSGASKAAVAARVAQAWRFTPDKPMTPAPPTAAGGLVFLAGDDGKVRALDAATGRQRWCCLTAGPILMPPTVAAGRAYVGSGDGNVYALDAATGRRLWTFRAAPVGRKIMLYGRLASTWPVNTGVLVRDGVAYFGAGVIDYDGTYVYALDAVTGRIKWQNNSSGHLSKTLRKGVSCQGTMTIVGDRLLLAGGNQVCPAAFDLKTGQCASSPPRTGRPQANRGQEVGVVAGKFCLRGGRLLYSAVEKVASPASFDIRTSAGYRRFVFGRVTPAWNDEAFVYVHGPRGKLTCVATDKLAALLARPDGPGPATRPARRRPAWMSAGIRAPARRWTSADVTGGNAIGLTLTANAVLALTETIEPGQDHPTWALSAFALADGKRLWRQPLKDAPLPGGVIVDRAGRIICPLQDGSVVCYAAPKGR